ncbi:MAG: hypothetical protein AAGF99_05410 [Bacteroidota bacterium]
MSVKDMRYNVMLALYFPILLYAMSTFDLDDSTIAVGNVQPYLDAEETVVLGQPFQARAMLAVGSGEGLSLNGSETFMASGDSMFVMETGNLLAENEDVREVEYAATMTVPQLGGGTREVPISGTFTVRRPEIVAVNAGEVALYRQCRNEVRIDVPGLEDRPLILNGTEARTLTLAPSGQTAGIRVETPGPDGNVFLGSKSFAVIDPPRPEIRVSNAGRSINNGDNLPRGRFALNFAVAADQEFAQRYPSDARYGVGSATVYIRRGLTASERLGTYNLSGGRLPAIRALASARPGDRIIVQLNNVYRLNYAGTSVGVSLNEGSRTFSFTIS